MDWQKIFTPPFVAAASVLLAGWVVLQAAVWGWDLHLMKEALPPAEPLYLLEEELGPYRQVDQRTLPKDVVDELGTERYLTRTYRYAGGGTGAGDPAVRLHVAYYTGLPDATPHIQERFYVVGGASGEEIDRVAVRLPSLGLEVPLKISAIAEGRSDRPRAAGHFFIANGTPLADTEEVRERVSDLQTRYAYWCRIEMLPGTMRDDTFRGLTEAEEAAEAIDRFLPHALPRILDRLPGGEGAGR